MDRLLSKWMEFEVRSEVVDETVVEMAVATVS